VRGSGSGEQEKREREAHRNRRTEDKVRGRLVKVGAWRLRGGHYDRRRGRSGLPRGGETSRPERKSAASRIVLDSRLPIPHNYFVRHPSHSRNMDGAREQPLLCAVLLRERHKLVNVPVARHPERVRGALARESDAKARRKIRRVAGKNAEELAIECRVRPDA
jgi:hypothetical protein